MVRVLLFNDVIDRNCEHPSSHWVVLLRMRCNDISFRYKGWERTNAYRELFDSFSYGVFSNMMDDVIKNLTDYLKSHTRFGLLCATSFLLWNGCLAIAEASQPNIVLILSDDQHWRDYGFMGHEHLQTPALDRLASESLVFSRGYVPISLCCPSLASLITGRYPHEHLITGNDPPEQPGVSKRIPAGRKLFEAGREEMTKRFSRWSTLPKLLGEHGYRSLQTG